jgi:hypothetical protein
VVIYYDNRFETINFGMSLLDRSIEKKDEFFIHRQLSEFSPYMNEKSLVASFISQGIRSPKEELEEGGFEIYLEDNKIFVTGADYKGTMYGLMDIAETIELYGIGSIISKIENPFLKIRGIKYNLPFEPYDYGDPVEKNIKVCLDKGYWEKYIDFLAKNRYNCLSLWSEHPFHMMFRLDKYPNTCPYNDVELERYKDLFMFIMSHSKKRGIDVYLITWNIRITSFVAEGLGLPAEIGDMFDQYNVVYDATNNIPNNTHEFDGVRQNLDVIKDYFKECIKTLAITYRDLKGIGTNCAEEMIGTAIERQDWVIDSYLRGIEESGRDLPFIMRTNMANGKIAKMFLDQYPSKEKYISWKYSNAHMYSSVNPQFEKLWNAWDEVDMNDIKVLYTVRNDDIHTLRWGDYDYIRDYVKGMKKPFVQGFYWGADGYIWGEDFQHAPNGHKTWKYDFEKHWHQFELLGRIGYNPMVEESIWIQKYKLHYGKPWGADFHAALKAASKIIPAVNRLFWINYDFQWHPESLLSALGFKTILDFMDAKPMPGIGTLGIREYANAKLKGLKTEGETPQDIVNIIKESVCLLNSYTKELRNNIPEEYIADDIECTLLDIEAWKELGEYYYNKFTAALELVFYESTGIEQHKDRAIQCLSEAIKNWKELSRIWSEHYMPYKMARVKYTFGWPYYIRDVKRDLEIARYFRSEA